MLFLSFSRMVRFSISFFVLLLLTTSASGQNFFDAEQLRKVTAVRVVIVDHVKDGCLLSADALKTNAEHIMRQAGIKVVKTEDEHPHQLLIKVVGAELKLKEKNEIIPFGACTAAVASNLLRDEYLRDGSVGRVQAFMVTGYTFVMKNQFQQQIGVIIDRYVSALAKQIAAARQN
jgi:hypothetical protein